MPRYKTPGVYVEEISKFSPSVTAVETAIPAFIGYTEKIEHDLQNLVNEPIRINSLVEFEEIFGGTYPVSFSISVTDDVVQVQQPVSLIYMMYYSIRLFYANGGGPCYVISVGGYSDTPYVAKDEMENGLLALEKEDEPTLILFPDATSLNSSADFYYLYKLALKQCSKLGDRFVICDVYHGDMEHSEDAALLMAIVDFRNGIGEEHLKYGAAYYPWLLTNYSYVYDAARSIINEESLPDNTTLKKEIPPEGDTEAESTSLFHINTDLYEKVVLEIEKLKVVLPPGSGIAGVYCSVDRTRGVWKVPANVEIKEVWPRVTIGNELQDNLKIDTSGKSINSIRSFTGKGILVWGGRTLAGNDNEWRYVSVRRFFNMVEESVKRATAQFVFEPNDANTWVKIKGMIENFLTLQWRDGALAGAELEDAFFVRVGLNQTMTANDILQGLMHIEIGMAVVRPAEFIILKFSHKMQES